MQLVTPNQSSPLRIPRGAIPSSITYLSDSLISDYVPFHSLFSGEYKKVGSKRYIIYNLPDPNLSTGGSSNRATHFDLFFRNYITPGRFMKGGRNYYTGKQLIYEIINGIQVPLYVLAVKSDYIYDVNFQEPDYSKFILLINNEFKKDERKLMFKFLERTYLPFIEAAGIDIVYTSNIQNWCFKKAKLSFEFSTIVQMKEFFNQTSKEALYGITGLTPAAILEARRIEQERRARQLEQREEQDRLLRERAAQQQREYREIARQQELAREAQSNQGLTIIDDSGRPNPTGDGITGEGSLSFSTSGSTATGTVLSSVTSSATGTTILSTSNGDGTVRYTAGIDPVSRVISEPDIPF